MEDTLVLVFVVNPVTWGGGREKDLARSPSRVPSLHKMGCGGRLSSCPTMTSRTLLLLASALLGTPGLTFSGLNPESYDLATAHLSDGEQFCQGLTQEDLQGDLLTERERQGIACWSCRKILQKLEDLVGEQPNEATINEAASRVCRNLGLLRGACKKIMRTCLRLISRDILAGKKPQEVCVDIKLCKRKAGLI
ncbi:granulysin [Equus asinus]|uniref:Saposin B-type domain-containing protein n=1 Tax=Equus asinus TaxID=9793 RepID=A0A9L0JYJ8_EQUAS